MHIKIGTMTQTHPPSILLDEKINTEVAHENTIAAESAQEKEINQKHDNAETSSTTDVAKNKEENHHPSLGLGEEASDNAEGGQDEAMKSAPQDPEKNRSKGKTALIMAALMMAVFLAALDMTIVTTALPTIAADFQVSNADYTWVGSAYLLGAAASTPTWGKVSDTFGRKPTMLVANVIFLIGSLICALSINVKMLLGGRAIQGIGGGGLIILANICITDLFSMR